MYYWQSQTAIHVASASLDSCLQSPTATQLAKKKAKIC